MSLILGILGVVIVLAALLSRAMERGPFSSAILFVAIGLVLGQAGVLRLPVTSEPVILIGVVTLTLALFTDAIKMQTEQLKRHWPASMAVLGPGTILTELAMAVAARWLLGLDVVPALLLGAVLASTDPVLLRDVLRDARTPQPVRQILSVESGMNDAVALPAILFLIAFSGGRGGSGAGWVEFAVPLFVLSPLLGIVVAWIAVRGLTVVDRRIGVRRDYESLYSIGIAFVAFAAAERLGGSGLLAAFAAGLTIAVSDLDLCECFLEYGETTAELMMLLTFVLFGSALVWPALEAVDWRVAAFAAVAVFVCRPVVLMLVLSRFRIPVQDKLFAAWHGPRGLNSILLALLVLVSGTPGGDRVFAVAGIVVLASVILHGILGTPLVTWSARAPAAELVPEPDAAEVPRISAPDLAAMLERGDPVLVVDVRKPGDLNRDPRRIPTAVHYPLDEAASRIVKQAPTGPIVLYCA
ncbi:MAG: cation:proton antiporter [Armatimonadota bacterium]|nr:cation:proton antiporter [Armatimonadota bacterium]MDR7549686.1 cation:proton antiporter [Armatimonadota bacterium]